MSLTDRLAQVQRARETGTLSAPGTGTLAAPAVDGWERRQTSPFSRGTGSLGLAGETEFELLTRELALTPDTFAAALGTTDLMVQRMASGLMQPTGATADRLRRLRALHGRLYELFQPYQALDFMRSANGELGWGTPADALAAGGLGRVEALVSALGSHGS